MEYRKSCKRFNNPGDAHALTFSCFHRQAFLSKDRSCYWLIEGIDRARVKLRFDVWAYVIMPEHAHLLLWPREPEYEISDVLSAIKQSVAKRALNYVRRYVPAFLSRMEDLQPIAKCTIGSGNRVADTIGMLSNQEQHISKLIIFITTLFAVDYARSQTIGTGHRLPITPV